MIGLVGSFLLSIDMNVFDVMECSFFNGVLNQFFEGLPSSFYNRLDSLTYSTDG